MGIEFDPASSSYYQTSYTGSAAPKEAVENAPSEMDAVAVEQMETSPRPEETEPATEINDPAAETAAGGEPPPDVLLETYETKVGSLVDTVI